MTRATRASTASSPGWDRTYAYDGDGLPLEQLAFDGTRRFVHHDQLGSTCMLTDVNGAVTSRRDFDAYGNPASSSAVAETPFGFAGQYTDGQTGLIYMRARWYDPRTGQFITADPIGHASGETNLYRYAGNDPINLADPTGLCSWNPFSSDSCAAEPAAKALHGLTGGLSTKIAGDVFDFNADCTGWGDSQVAFAAGFAGLGKFKNGARLAATGTTSALSQAGKRRLAKRLGGIPRSSAPVARGGSAKTGRWWEYDDVKGRRKIVVEHPDGTVHVGIPKPQSTHTSGGPPKYYDYGNFGHVSG